MTVQESVSVPGTVPGIRQAIAAFERFGGRHCLSARVRWRVAVGIDEILSNIVRYGGVQAAVILTFSLEQDGTVSVELVDDATPFNPLLAPPPDRTSPLERRPAGTLGIALVRMLMDDTAYERRDGRNHFVMRCRAHAHR